MRKFIILMLVLIFLAILWVFPLYFCVNLVLWLFHSTLRITLLQSFGLCLLATIINKLLFKNREDK